MNKRESILLVDFGSETVQQLATKIREKNVHCHVVSFLSKKEYIGFCGAMFVGADEKLSKEEIAWWRGYFENNNIPFLSQIDTFENENASVDSELDVFLFQTCGCEGNWTAENIAKNSVAEIKAQIGDKKVICALSGGVDSSVAATLVAKAIGKQLTCVFVDHGLLRLGEADSVESFFSARDDLKFIRVDAEHRFLQKLSGVSDPEMKRKIIGEEFINVFDEEAKKIGDVEFLVQGTIYPDIIESGFDGGKLVKSHHNVGGLPKRMKLKLCEPLRDLFKTEVRNIGKTLGMPENMVLRQPFPGPGLGVRCIGDITKERLDILRHADHIFCTRIEELGLNKKMGQFFAVITNMRSVGVKDGERTYGYTIALRAVDTADFMTAKWSRIPLDALDEISEKICTEVPGVGRVVYDITSKPPGTIEWE